MTRSLALLLVPLLTACPVPAEKGPAPQDSADSGGDTVETDEETADSGEDTVESGEDTGRTGALEGELETENSIGRKGYFFLPEGWDEAPLPLFVAFHGTGSRGQDMVSVLRALASAEGFGIVAPDSRRSPSGEYTWEVGTEPDEVTEDLLHAQACLDEVLSREGVLLDPERLLSGGFSGGASTGPYVGTRDPRFTHCAVLHGGVFPGGLGENLIPCWFSTGSEDTVRSPEHVAGQAESMSRAGFPEVVFSVYPGGHEMIPEETAALAAWWLRDEPPTPWSSLAP